MGQLQYVFVCLDQLLDRLQVVLRGESNGQVGLSGEGLEGVLVVVVLQVLQHHPMHFSWLHLLVLDLGDLFFLVLGRQTGQIVGEGFVAEVEEDLLVERVESYRRQVTRPLERVGERVEHLAVEGEEESLVHVVHPAADHVARA